MTQAVSRSFVGRGRVWAKIGSAARFELGNLDKLTLSAQVDEDKVKDFRTGGAGTYATYSNISSASLAGSLVDHNANNLALALLGTATAVAGSTVTDEVITAKLGALVPLTYAGGSAHVVTNSAGSTTYVLNTDYQVTGAGIIALAAGAITADQSLKVDYTYPAQTNVQALLSSVQEMQLIVDGLNDADSGKAHVITVHRWKPGPSGLDLISDKLGRLSIAGEILPDTTITGSGISQYFKLQQVD